MEKVTTTDLAKRYSTILDEVYYNNAIFMVTKHEAIRAVIIPVHLYTEYLDSKNTETDA